MKSLRAFVVAALIAIPATGLAQQPVARATPPANPADVGSLDSIMKAVYDVISGPAGQKRNWDRMRSLFIPGARLGYVVRAGQGGPFVPRINDLEHWIATSGASIERNGFFENEISRRTELYAHMGHAFSTYESRHTASDPQPFARGINSFQLLNDGTRWWVVSIYWEQEGAASPLPPRYVERVLESKVP